MNYALSKECDTICCDPLSLESRAADFYKSGYLSFTTVAGNFGLDLYVDELKLQKVLFLLQFSNLLNDSTIFTLPSNCKICQTRSFLLRYF